MARVTGEHADDERVDEPSVGVEPAPFDRPEPSEATGPADERPAPPTAAPAGGSSAERADAAIRAMASGASPADEAFALSNRFTDDATARMAARVRALFRRPTR